MSKKIELTVRFGPGDLVSLRPFPDMEGIVRSIYWDGGEVMYSVGYFNSSGERRIDSFYDFELTKKET